MKAIKIITDTDCDAAIEAALAAVNGKATAFTVTDATTVRQQAMVFVKSLSLLPLRDRAGAVGTYTPAGPWAKAYKYPPASTTLTFRISGDGKDVYLADVAAVTVYPRQGERRSIAIKPAAHVRYVAARAADFGVLKAA